MNWVVWVIGICIGVAAGGGLAWLAASRRRALDAQRLENAQSQLQESGVREEELRKQLAEQLDKLGGLKAERATLEERLAQERRQAAEKLALLDEAQKKLSDAFKALSSEALKSNNQSFLDLARETLGKFQQGARDDLGARHKAIEQLTKPIHERLEKFDGKLDELERSRVGAYRALDQQLKSLVDTHLPQLHRETENLVKALRQPATRGRWGEIQLRRVVEMAGMLEHCDFEQQVSQATETGRLRPDLIVHLPGGRHIVVDAKTPIEGYLEAIEARDDAVRDLALARHARHLRNHIAQLGRKDYFAQFDPAPEFVVLFVPGEAFFSAALAEQPDLIEYGTTQGVIPASPTTLIALLKAVAYGWRQEALAKNAREVADLGRELYERIAKLAEHWSAVGRRLDQTVAAYNQSVGTLERRVLVSARRFHELKAASGGEIPEIVPVEHNIRALAEKPEEQGSDSDQ